jgi:hypothetical protein
LVMVERMAKPEEVREKESALSRGSEFPARELLHLVVQVGDEFRPVLEADLEDLAST